ncbi:gene transfer agent family protein [uncultured Cohaesibacter sp.]|uniref:gene transfer agent family protein n=1 Tax=uncultured Cohaesibacter sp. TaxID=1002546 RepID=UPI0029C9A569|nr:gene transfer agent family protein [uncultured Cohaesibacter sp.]
MTNRRRGEISICLDDQIYRLCLTLAALAELEDSMELDNIGSLAERFSGGRVRSGDLIKILGAALRAGGAEISDREAAAMRCKGGAAALTAALVDLLRETFSPDLEDTETVGNPLPNPT